MPLERRLAAALLLLIGAVPLMWVYLPQRPDALLTPMFALACATSAVLAPSTRSLQSLSGTTGATALVLFDLSVGDPVGIGIVVLLPLVVLCLSTAPWHTLLSVTGAAALIASVAGTESATRRALAFGTVTDGLSLILIAGWAAWIVVIVGRDALVRREAHDMANGCRQLGSALARDKRDLDAILTCLADPALRPRISGHGLTPTQLNVATPIDGGKRVLLAVIHGEPLATLSVAWMLRTAAQAGVRKPATLMELARTQLDEINAPSDLHWVGLLDMSTHACETSPVGALAGLPKPFTRFEDEIDEEHSQRTISDLLGIPTRLEKLDSIPRETALDTITALALPLSVGLLFVGPAAWAPPWMLTGVLVHILSTMRLRRGRRDAQRLNEQFDRLVDCRDDLHHPLARLHGTLLPYQVRVGDYLATAHRLRGDVLDGTFADMLSLDDDKARVIAGEVAGEGIAARFLGMAAQSAMRARVQARSHPLRLQADVERVLREAAARLDYPLHLELGIVSFNQLGHVSASGSLVNMVVVRTPSDETPMLNRRARLDAHTQIYLTPASSRPGPEETAPALTAPLAAGRLADIIANNRWRPETDALASLFSLVFDGTTAPAHGTLIRLERTNEATCETAQPAAVAS
ncbi:MAG: hypothetical protein V3V08_01705 [Nannocystaceae bacterium]